MMLYKIQSDETDLINVGFFDQFTGNVSVTLLGESRSQVTVFNPSTGITTVLNGSNLSVSQAGVATSGNVSSITFLDGTTQIGEISGVSWRFVEFDDAIRGLEVDNIGPLVRLINAQPITFDLREATDEMDLEGLLYRFAEEITRPITVLSGPFDNFLLGGTGDDTFFFAGGGDNGFVYTDLEATPGDDTLNFTGVSSGRFVSLDYDQDYANGTVERIVANLNGETNVGSINGSTFTHTLVDVADIMGADGIRIAGSLLDDIFNVTVAEGQWTSLQGKEGNDTFNLTFVGGRASLDFSRGEFADPDGLDINLATGVVANDGLGFRDTINITGDPDGNFQIVATDGDDTLIGSAGDDWFLSLGGSDTIDGGEGNDFINYSWLAGSSITIDLEAGTASGVFDGDSLIDTLTNIESIRGSRQSDTITGSSSDEFLQGIDGNDTIDGAAGDDRLFGGDGNDVLYDGAGEDALFGGDGDDTVFVSGSSTDGGDYIDLGAGNDTIDLSNHAGGSVAVYHDDVIADTAFAVSIDSVANTATVDKGVFGTTTILDAAAQFGEDDFILFGGSQLDDTFTIAWTGDNGVGVHAGRGNDTIDLTGTTGRVLFRFVDDILSDDPLSGIDVNLATGVVANDGLGGSDTIIGGANSITRIIGTTFGDTFTGRDGDDEFVVIGGVDQLDGGGGTDTVFVANGSSVGGIFVDLANNTLTSTFDGVEYVSTIENFENAEGFDNADILRGDSGNNELRGEGGNDNLRGEGGNDVVLGGAGDDYIYGDSFEVRYALPEANQVFRLYQATFNRAPDEGGHKRWTSELETGEVSLAEVREAFVGSQEFQNRYAGFNDADFVKELYINVLDRDFDQGEVTQQEIDNWTNRITNTFTRADVVNGFAESQQLINNTNQAANKLAVNNNPAVWSDDVYRLYQATLDRAPDFNGFMNWSERLTDGRSLTDVISGFTNSQEFVNTFGALTDPEDFVKLLYKNVLGRDFDAGEVTQSEINGWTSRLGDTFTRANIVEGFSQSVEFTNNTAQDVKAWIRAQGVDDEIDGGAGTNVLAGGSLADQFVFNQEDAAVNTVVDLEAWDFMSFEGFGYTSVADAREHMVQSGGNVVFSDQGTDVTLRGFDLSDITDDMILI